MSDAILLAVDFIAQIVRWLSVDPLWKTVSSLSLFVYLCTIAGDIPSEIKSFVKQDIQNDIDPCHSVDDFDRLYKINAHLLTQPEDEDKLRNPTCIYGLDLNSLYPFSCKDT